MAEKMAEIKEKFALAKEGELEELISFYSMDERSGVKAEIQKARKRILQWDAEIQRTALLWKYENEYSVYSYICGVDEVGRGPLAGPVVAGAVILPKNCDILYINDSKKLSEKKREELYEEILEKAVSTGLGCVSPERIDEVNILQATYEAMREAISNLSVLPDILLNDAVTIPQIELKQIPIVKGDAKSISIGAASIIAKVTRDRLMVEYDKVFPEYGFASNKGYGSSFHVEALRKYGPSPIHRKSFIKKLLETDELYGD